MSLDLATRARPLLATLALCLAATPGSADLEVILIEGDIAPGTGDRPFFGFTDLSAAGNGWVGFWGGVQGPSDNAGLFTRNPVGVVELRDLVDALRLRINGLGHVAYRVGSDGFHVDPSGVIRQFADNADPSPLGPLLGQIFPVGVDATGGVYFTGVPGLHYSDPLGAYAFIASDTSFETLNAVGELGMIQEIGGVRTVVLREAGGTIVPRAADGDAAPGTGGASFDQILFPSLNASGAQTFWSSLVGGTESEGLFYIDPAGTVSPLVFVGDVAPGTGGATFSALEVSLEALSDEGHVAFHAELTGGTASNGIFRVDTTGAVEAIALQGQAAPLPFAGATFSGLHAPVVDDRGSLFFESAFAGGPPGVGEGLFQFRAVPPAPPVPTLGTPARAVLGLALLAAAGFTSLLTVRRFGDA